ncbi:hypothetical protein WEI85_07870 [Actinomycetes bacterium KLBMP 9797]
MQDKVSRRGVIQLAGGAALGAAAIGSLGLGSRAERPSFRLVSGQTDLLIRDGSPHWWNSPDIWVVPGSNPNGPPGSPFSGGQAWVWARVQNVSRMDASDVAVNYYWGDPSTAMYFSTVNHIGTATLDIAAGATLDVLCPTPWNVVTVNGGHECLIATASLPDDPALPNLIDPPSYQNVAQKNLTVILAPDENLVQTWVQADLERPKKVQISWGFGGPLPAETLAYLGRKGYRFARQPAIDVTLAAEPKGEDGPVLDLFVPAGKRVPFYVRTKPVGPLAPGEYQVVHIVEHEQGVPLGGISFLVVQK